MATPSRIAVMIDPETHYTLKTVVVDEGKRLPEQSWVLRMEADCSVTLAQTPLAASDDNPLPLADVRVLTEQANQVMSIASTWRAAHQESSSNLQQYGLVPRLITNEDTQRSLGIVSPLPDTTFADGLREAYGPLGVLDPVVWTAPDADLNEFGCAYITTNGRYTSAAWSRRSNTLQWGLRNVGISRRGETHEPVSWDDEEGIANLARQCLVPAETHTVQAALTDSDQVSMQARAFNQNTAIRQARENFAPKSKQIRPILVKKILEEVERENIHTKHNMWSSATVDNLLSWQVTGRDSEQIYMCARLTLMERRPVVVGTRQPQEPTRPPVDMAKEIKDIGLATQNKLDVRRLGQVGIVLNRRDDTGVVLVAKDVEEMWEYAEAVGLGEDPVQVLTEQRDAWVSLD